MCLRFKQLSGLIPAQTPGRILLFAVMTTPLLSIFSGLAMAPLLALTAIGLLATGSWRHLKSPALPPVATIALGLFLVWALTSCWRSESGPGFALHGLAQTFGVVVGGYVVVMACRRIDQLELRHILFWLAIGLGIALTVTLGAGLAARTLPPAWFNMDAHSFSFVSVRFDRTLTIVVMMLWPALYGLDSTGHRRLALGLAVLAAVSIFLNQSMAAKSAVLIGWTVWGIERVLPTIGVKLVRAAVIIFLLGFPFAAQHLPTPDSLGKWDGFHTSALHRMVIWRYVADHIAEKPIAGWGYESSRIIGHKETFSTPLPSGIVLTGEILPLHPHNETLQVWLELGAVGAGLLAVFLWGVIGSLQKPEYRHAAPYAAAMIAGTFFICNVSYGIWQSWWTSSIWLAAATLAAITGPMAKAEAPRAK